MEIVEIAEKPELLKPGIDFFWTCWGSDSNYDFYRDCIENSLDDSNKLPKFFIGLVNDKIVGTYALLTNDLISRQDLMPWLACLFVVEEFRNRGFAAQLLEHGLNQARLKGFSNLYLSTDLENFYEKKGWDYLCDGYGVSGGVDKIYCRKTM